jgi:polysaccharide chain length determinant protein (PEP-CTERM system associated)
MELWYFVARKALLAAWHRRWLVVATAWVVCILGWTGVFFIPDSYECQARLYVDTDAVLTPLLHGIAIDTTTASQLEVMQKTLLSRPNLNKLINATNLNQTVSTSQQRERLIDNLGLQTRVTSDGRNLFTIAYRNKDPQIAHDVIAGLINIFLDETASTNQSDMANAQKFLQTQIASYETQLRAAEQRRADFRDKYRDILPLEGNGGLSRLDSARVDVRDLAARLNDAISNRDALKQEASITSQLIEYGRGTGTGAGQDPELENAELKLAELRTRFTEENPDVIAAKRLVEALKAGTSKPPLGTAPGAANSVGARAAIPNPMYEQVRVKLVEAEANISALNSRLETARAELARMEALAQAAPHVAAEYENLDRDYAVLRQNYEELLVRRETSNITAAADTGADKVRLRVVDPPQLPSIPVAPNRSLLVSLVLLAGLGAAVALSVVLSQTDRSISDLGQLRELGQPVLGGISLVQSAPEKPREGYGPQLRVAAMILLLLLIYGGLLSQIATGHRMFI